MNRTLSMALLATVAMAGLTPNAFAGSSDSYAVAEPEPTVTTFTAAAPPVMETYVEPVTAMPVIAEPVRDGYYDESRFGGNAEFGYEQKHACGGVTTGEKCLVILSDHMRRVRLDRPAGTILVGNPLIADVTVLGNDTLFVSARSIGSTNIIVLDKQGNEIDTYEVFVREPRTKRVVLNNGGAIENYQCAPHCERALTQSDSPIPYRERSGIISTDLGLDSTAIGLQSGPNPNTDPGGVPPGMGGGAMPPMPAGGGGPGSAEGIANSVGALTSGPGFALMGAMGGLAGGGAPAAAPAAPAPARTEAPPLPSGGGGGDDY